MADSNKMAKERSHRQSSGDARMESNDDGGHDKTPSGRSEARELQRFETFLKSQMQPAIERTVKQLAALVIGGQADQASSSRATKRGTTGARARVSGELLNGFDPDSKDSNDGWKRSTRSAIYMTGRCSIGHRLC